jgi:hypothetical protein
MDDEELLRQRVQPHLLPWARLWKNSTKANSAFGSHNKITLHFSCLTLIAFDGISMYLKMSFILLMLILGKKIV